MPPRFDPRKLSRAQREQRIQAARVKADMLRLGHSLTHAAHDHGIRPYAVLRWFPDSIVRGKGGWVALRDRQAFDMTIVAKAGVLDLVVRSSAERSEVGRHYSAIGRLLDPDIGDPEPLIAMRGTVVADHELETDPDIIEELFFAGELDVVSIYVLDL